MTLKIRYHIIIKTEKEFHNTENKMEKEKIKSIEKALDLLELLPNNKEIGITEISKELHMGISTVHRILNTLKSRGYIIQNKQRSKYALGIQLFVLGCKVQNAMNLIESVTPFLHKLSQYTKESINFAILEGREVVCLSKIESSEVLRTDIKIGARLPAHCTAVGKALLAFLPEREFTILYGKANKKLSTSTPNSISSLIELKKRLKKIKKDGYSTDEEELNIGINCFAVPILNKDGKSVASISITGPSSRFTLSEKEKLKDVLMSISKDVSNHLIG